MKRIRRISFDRWCIIAMWLLMCGVIWIPVVHGIGSSPEVTELSYGFCGYFVVTETSDGHITHHFDRFGFISSIVVMLAWSAASARWWQLRG